MMSSYDMSVSTITGVGPLAGAAPPPQDASDDSSAPASTTRPARPGRDLMPRMAPPCRSRSQHEAAEPREPEPDVPIRPGQRALLWGAPGSPACCPGDTPGA